MRTIILIILALLLAPLALGYASTTPNLELQVESVTPAPAQPGDDITLSLRLMNNGGEKATGTSIELKPHPNFRIRAVDAPQQEQTICVGCSRSYVYEITVSPDAHTGEYPLTFTIGSNQATFKQQITILVRGTPDLVLKASENPTIAPGDQFNTDLEVENIGTGTARNIKITSQSDFLVPLGAGVEVIRELSADDAYTIKTTYMVKPSTEPDAYPLQYLITYDDETGNKLQDNYTVGVPIGDKADVQLQRFEMPTLIEADTPTIITGVVENTGTGDAENLELTLNTPRQTYRSFIGHLEAGDDAPFSFEVIEEKGDHKATLQMTYADDFGEYQSRAEAQYEAQAKSRWAWVVAAIAIMALIVGIVLWRRRG